MALLLFVALICLFFISRKSQRVMNSLLEIMTNPEQAKIQDATRVLGIILKDEINKIDNNFKAMANELQNQIKHTEQIQNVLTEQNNTIATTAEESTRKISMMAQRLDNTIEGLKAIVSSSNWQDVQQTTDNFSAVTDGLLTRIESTSKSTSEKAEKIQEQITQLLDSERTANEQLQTSFQNNTTSMEKMGATTSDFQQKLNELTTSVATGFENVTKSSTEYDENMKNNDKLLNDYLTKLADFTKHADKELTHQVNKITETANVVGANIRLSEASIDKQLRKLEVANESLNNSTTNTMTAVRNISSELNELTGSFRREIGDFSTDVVKEVKDVAGVANETLETTKHAATEFARSVQTMGTEVRGTLIEMNKAHAQLSGRSADLIKMSAETTEQMKPLSEMIKKYSNALPDLATGSRNINDNLNQIVNTLTEKIDLMKTTISESLVKLSNSSTQLGDLAGESRQQMIDLMSDYAKAVEAMQSLNKQMMVARASAPMDAIKVAPSPTFKPISTSDFMVQVEKSFVKLYEQAIDLTRTSSTEIPDIVWEKYNSGDNKIFAKWLVKMFNATDRKQIRDLIKSDKVFKSQATQFVRNFEKILNGANQTNDAAKIKNTLLKTDLGIIYDTIMKNM